MPERSRLRNPRLAVLGLAGTMTVGGLIGLAQQAGAASCPQNGLSVTCTFSDPGTAENFVVPAGVTSAQFTLQGGAGGDGAARSANTGGAGGDGGTTTRTIALTPGTSLGIFVGGPGSGGEGCDSSSQGGVGGTSGGTYQTGGNGGNGFGSDEGCAGGGGGGGTFVMSGTATPADIEYPDGPGDPDPLPLLAAGGGGGGGGGFDDDVDNAGGSGGGMDNGPENGHGESGGGGGAVSTVEGYPGTNAIALDNDGSPVYNDAGGGGGGGLSGGLGGDIDANGEPFTDTPGSGGGGGSGYPESIAMPATVPASVAASIPASLPASPADDSAPAEVNAVASPGPSGSAGYVSITYSVPAPNTPSAPSATDTANCSPANDPCVATPPAGQETEFKVVATGGNEGAQLFAILNGGLPPTCKSVGGQLSPDWVQFGFTDPKDGRTWSKKIRVTGTDPASKEAAQRELAQTQICFAAPYKFVVKRGEKLTKVGKSWEGLLAHCKSRIVAEAKANNPDLARPCILNRSLVTKGDGFVVRVNYFVPNGELDPQGRSLKKKKKKKG